jgi:hypothetical protein
VERNWWSRSERDGSTQRSPIVKGSVFDSLLLALAMYPSFGL